MNHNKLTENPWAFGPWCFVIDDVRLLATPIPCRGMQGWWSLIEEHREALSELCPMGTYVTSALTLLQPYATAIACGPKRIENRPQRRTIPPGGIWLGLHAGKALYAGDGWVAEEWVKAEMTQWRSSGMWSDAPPVDQLPRGCLLGAMHITACLRYPE